MIELSYFGIALIGMIINFILSQTISVNDQANSFSVIFGCKAMKPDIAMMSGGMFEFIGSLIYQHQNYENQGSHYIYSQQFKNNSNFIQDNQSILFGLSSMVSIIIVISIFNIKLIPISSSYVIMGAQLSINIQFGLQSQENFMNQIFLMLILGFVVIFSISYIISRLIQYLIDEFVLKSSLEQQKSSMSLVHVCSLVIGLVNVIQLGPLQLDLYQSLILIVSMSLLVIISFILMSNSTQFELIKSIKNQSEAGIDYEDNYKLKEAGFVQNLIFNCCLSAFIHGANDVGSILHLFLNLILEHVYFYKIGANEQYVWSFVIGFGFCLGSVVAGKHIARSMANITTLTYSSSFAIQVSFNLTQIIVRLINVFSPNQKLIYSTTICILASQLGSFHHRMRSNDTVMDNRLGKGGNVGDSQFQFEKKHKYEFNDVSFFVQLTSTLFAILAASIVNVALIQTLNSTVAII